MTPNETRVSIAAEADIVTARQHGRSLAAELGFEGANLTLIALDIAWDRQARDRSADRAPEVIATHPST